MTVKELIDLLKGYDETRDIVLMDETCQVQYRIIQLSGFGLNSIALVGFKPQIKMEK